MKIVKEKKKRKNAEKKNKNKKIYKNLKNQKRNEKKNKKFAKKSNRKMFPKQELILNSIELRNRNRIKTKNNLDPRFVLDSFQNPTN